MHYVEAGSGPLTILLHGFPELWYSWRHQLGELAEAGFHAVAPDLRGYGRTDCPRSIDAYNIFQLTGDIVGLVSALQETNAIIIGHDWGATIGAYLAVLRPDLVLGLALLSMPYVPRRPVSQTEWEQQKYPGRMFYQSLLRSPASEQIFEFDVRSALLGAFYSLSGQAKAGERWQVVKDPNAVPSMTPLMPKMPTWLTTRDLDFLEAEFRRTGFTGGLNYYRNMDRNWMLTPFLAGAKIHQPSMFICGERDPVNDFLADAFDALESNVPNLRMKTRLADIGHWTQQECPELVNRLLIDFVKSFR
jgi:pimeloyl-ACP methyl ester carboxylesterase